MATAGPLMSTTITTDLSRDRLRRDGAVLATALAKVLPEYFDIPADTLLGTEWEDVAADIIGQASGEFVTSMARLSTQLSNARYELQRMQQESRVDYRGRADRYYDPLGPVYKSVGNW